MPFTISHAAAVLPLRSVGQFRLPLAALMIGSMSPDFAYFLPIEPNRLATHSLAGLFWFCLPSGLAIWLLFVHLLERPTMALLPETWRARITPSDTRIALSTLAIACAAIILGAVTHIVWDSFTHGNSPVTRAFPVLRTVVLNVDNTPVRVYRLLQHLSTIAGMAVLVAWAYRLFRPSAAGSAGATQAPANAFSHGTRIGAVAFAAVASFVPAITNFAANPDIPFIRRLFHFAIGGMAGLALAWIGVAIWIRWRSPHFRT